MSNFQHAYDKLNAEQRAAVDTIDGPLLVIAGPGSGKTELLSVRVANILDKADVYPQSILCLTFTDSAAVNMRQRLHGLIGPDAYNVQIHTFHSFAVDVIERYPEYFYNGARFSAADELVQRDVLEQIFSTLPHDDALSTMHPEQGYVYLRDAKQNITHCKRAGVTPQQLQELVEANSEQFKNIHTVVVKYFAERISKKLIADIPECVAALEKVAGEDETTIAFELAASLKLAQAEAADTDSTKPLSAWKQTYLKKDADKNLVLKDSLYTDKLTSFAHIYAEYRKQLAEQGYYDFDDMIMDVLQALQDNETLRYDLQEQYLYMLVDEFQDTNDAQMRLLELLTNNEMADAPNVMAVGDDDQAIYKFQGAELRNMIQFTERYPDTSVVTLRENYRSTEPILDLAQGVIQHNTQRLSQLLPEIEKQLVANVDSLDTSDIVHHTSLTAEHEYTWVADEIAAQLAAGTEADEIAVITRNHKELRELVPYLQAKGVPVRYDRQQDVFTQPHVYQLIQMAKFVVMLTRQDQAAVDELLPEILSYPFLEVDRSAVWQVAVQAKQSRKPWLDIMAESDDTTISQLADWFQQLAKDAEHEPLAFMLDTLIGGREATSADGEAVEYTSQFRNYYFSEQRYTGNPQEYISFLSSLRVFVQAVRDHQPGVFLRLRDLVKFVQLHQKNNIALTDTSAFVNSSSAVQLLTAHKAKGLEFHTVFVISCQEHVWMKRGKTNLIPMPLNLPITPDRDSVEDQLRLVYVALTRAKHRLYVTSYSERDNGREAERLRVLPDVETVESVEHVAPPVADVLANAWETYHSEPIAQSEEAVLKELVKEYQMSVTHLNNFLNVASGGPQSFLLQNLLRFPQAKQPAGAYGTAVHAAIERLYTELRGNGQLASQEQFVQWFVEQLQREEMRPGDYSFFERKGKDAMALYYDQQKDSFAAEHVIEANFAKQGVLIGQAHLAGKIDKMVPFEDEGAKSMTVVDFKTGKAFSEWKGKTPYDKIKLHNYKRQLIFYKLLVENSRDYSEYTVNTGVLEFVEPSGNATNEIVQLDVDITEDDVTRLRRLIEVVYGKIVNLDFPEVGEFEESVDGIIAFEDSLLS